MEIAARTIRHDLGVGERFDRHSVVDTSNSRRRLSRHGVACLAAVFGLTFSNAAVAEVASDGMATSRAAHVKKKKHRAPKTSAAASTVPANARAAAPVSMPVPLSPARFDKNLGLKGWNIPFPSFGDTITQDAGGWRTKLAEYGIGFIEYNAMLGATNMLNTPTSNKGQQAYWGQQPSGSDTSIAFLTVDMGHYGIPNGQIQASGVFTTSTWEAYLAHNFTLNRLAYYQGLWDNRVELLIGYIGNGTAFVGPFVGGNLASPFGQSASIPYELGLSNTPAVAPTAQIKINITPNLYEQFAVQRSLPPTANSFLTNSQVNPTGFDFDVPGGKALYVNEVGYKSAAAPNDPYTWIRGGGLYNTSQYVDYSKPGSTRTNEGFYLLADRQLWQFDPSSRATAYRGIYAGGTVMWAAPETNVVSQYYEARLYDIGPFPSRPKDQISLVYSHSEFSGYLANTINRASAITGNFAQKYSNTITTTYTYNVSPGFYVTGGIAYTDHPSFQYIKAEGSSLTFLASIFTVF
jgi:porin